MTANNAKQYDMIAELLKTLIQYPNNQQAIKEFQNLIEKILYLLHRWDTIDCDSHYHEKEDFETVLSICKCLTSPSLKIDIYDKRRK